MMPKYVFNNEAQAAEARERCYGLLASVYNSLPSASFIATLVRADVRSIFSSSLQSAAVPEPLSQDIEQGLQSVEEFRNKIGKMQEAELLVRLGVERTRLFRGIKRGYGPPPPYESVYTGGRRVMGDEAQQIKNLYTEFGYPFSEATKELPDYVGLEIDFMRYLCGKEAQAWKAGNQSKAMSLLNIESDFMCKHVCEWVPRFCDEVLADAKETLYQGIARLTKAFILIETERLQTMVAEGR